MPSPLYLVAVAGCLGGGVIETTSYLDSATTQEARSFAERLHQEDRDSNSVDAWRKPVHPVEAAIWHLFAEHGQDNWDGAGAKALDVEAAHRAIAFIRALPDDVPMPEVGVDPDGAVTLDWAHSRHHSLTACIDASGSIPYAWIDHGDRGHAVERFDGVVCPKRLVRTIVEMAGAGDAAIRVA